MPMSNWHIGPASYVARWVIIAVACEDEVHEDTSDELAIHAAKDFLGVDISCASCHDGARHLEKINSISASGSAKSLEDGGVLRQDERAPPHRDQHGSGRVFDRRQRPRLRPVGAHRASAPRRGRRGLLDPVYMFTGETPDPAKHPRTGIRADADVGSTVRARTVNLLWAEMFGVGIVEPVF